MKLVIDTQNKIAVMEELSSDEVFQNERIKEQAEQQVLLDSLKPSIEDAEKAEREIETITLLQEVGLI